MKEKLYALGLAQSATENIIWKFCPTPVEPETKAEFPTRVDIRWNYSDPGGMPAGLLLDEMIELECLLNELPGEYSASRTGGNRKEFTFYTNNVAAFEDLVDNYPVELAAEQDSDWAAHEGMLLIFLNAPRPKLRKFRPKRINYWKKG